MKKRNMKVLALLMTVTMAGTMLAGCGDSGSTSTGSSGGATASSSGTADASSDATAASSSTADASSADDVVGELPRNETLYFAGQQWGTVNDYNPMSANSNNAMVIAQGDASRVLVYETLYMWNPLDAKMYPLLADGDHSENQS